ncbi:hypothetical protein [Paraburkholderia sp. J63]|uniref:hypothetical protein n=1 Tax=Paraburkholderia sp. J63 TaxID=2805434 RepID=UPI002ABDD11B|nr:hypothetical protein [Paraburkholderia sp. J63]
MQAYTHQQENLALSFVANAGVDLNRPEASTLYRLINESLHRSAALSGKFTVVWGPSLYYRGNVRFPKI